MKSKNKYEPQISIIIVNYNGKKWLNKCLCSLFAQSYKRLEVIVVDNNSSDRSIEFIKKYYPDTIVIESSENFGFAKGNSIGINHAKGEVIVLLNNDTWVEATFMKNILACYLKNKCDVIAPRSKDYFAEEESKPYVSIIDPIGHPVFLRGGNYTSKKPFFLTGVCLVFSKKLYLSTQGLDSNFFMYYEEVDWFWRLILLKKRFKYVENVYVYHVGAGSTGKGVNENIFRWRNENSLQMLLKNYEWHNLLWVLPLYISQNIFEILFFLIILKPKISFSYVEGWIFNVIHLKRTLKERRWVQQNRKIGDMEVLKRMYIGIAKLYHLTNYYSGNFGK